MSAASHSDAWAYLSGYVAEMARDGSAEARSILRYMVRLKPDTWLGLTTYMRDALADMESVGSDGNG